MKTVQEALGGALGDRVGRPTGQRVHRHTRTARGQERAFWQPWDPKNTARMLQAAEKYDRVQRMGHRTARNRRSNGALGHVGLEVLRELLRLIDRRTGRLDPAITTIATRIGRSVAAVVDALRRLRDHGFLNWIRRYVPTGQAGIRGPQVQQTSNAYQLTLPAALATAMAAPPPDDDTHRRLTEAAEAEAMIDSLSLPEQAYALVENEDLARHLARLGAAIERNERDSGRQNESNQS